MAQRLKRLEKVSARTSRSSSVRETSQPCDSTPNGKEVSIIFLFLFYRLQLIYQILV